MPREPAGGGDHTRGEHGKRSFATAAISQGTSKETAPTAGRHPRSEDGGEAGGGGRAAPGRQAQPQRTEPADDQDDDCEYEVTGNEYGTCL